MLRGFILMAIALTLLNPGSLAAAQSSQPAKVPAQLQAACDKGDGQACYDLGERYEKGEGVAKNAARAVTLYERSCEIGYAGNCWYLGTVYEDGGFGLVTPDVNRAAALYRKGCDRGDGNACFSLGLLYKAGRGVPRNPAAAAAFIRKGCVDLASGFCEDSGGLAVNMSGLGAPARPQASAPSSPSIPAPAAASQMRTVPSAPSDQSLFSIFGVRLGADRFDAVKTMLDRNRNIFFNYFEGTSALNEATRMQVSRRLVVSDARFAGIGSRGARVWFDFTNEADPILSTVTVLYGPGTTGLMAERIAALTQQFGADDGKGNATQWHRVVPGADIALFANLQTGAVDERYAYSREQPGRAAPARAACPAIKVTVRFINASANVMAFKAGPVSSGALFNWTVSAGSIASGQGTSELWLSTSGLARGTPITADVAVTEDPGCGDRVRKASVTGKVP